jgi:PiT family inorganic phosphate transporter
METLTYAVVALALSFDFVNGFHDAANAIATIVATKVLSPVKAVAMSALGNFSGMLFGTIFGVHIANTIGKGILNTSNIGGMTGVYLIFAVLVGAIAWDIITWLLGLPTSSSHALVGGLVGAGLAMAGTGAILGPAPEALGMFLLYSLLGGAIGALASAGLEMSGKGKRHLKRSLVWGFAGGWVISAALAGWYYDKQLSGLAVSVIFMVVSPLIGLGMAFLLTSLVIRLGRRSRATKVNWYFRKLQLVSSFFYSVMHGTSDAQKVIGIVTITLVFDGTLKDFTVQYWTIVACFGAISLGTFFGGWKIVKTMASKITRLLPYQGFCAETGGGLVLMTNAIFGIPVSTTHVISSSIMGVGATKRLSAVRWGVARNVIWAWILTIPMSALMSYITFGAIRLAGLA